jgi:phosphopantetheine adenylyltransferase
MKKIFPLLIVIVIASFAITEHVSAQSSAAQKALEGVKESVGTLVNAKDENNPNEIAFRTETFKKVIDFSIVELKDLRVKFLTAVGAQNASSTIGIWRDHILSRMTEASEFYEQEKKNAAGANEGVNIEKIKTDAENFKKWREDNFSPLAEEVNDFLLVEQQKNSLDTAEKRWEKIQNDIMKLKKVYSAKKMQELEKLLNDAQKMNIAARDVYERAQDLFYETYIAPFETKVTTTTVQFLAEEEMTLHASSTESNSKMSADENASSTAQTPPPSIRGLIKDSLTNVKRTYQIFIEMSGLVRKLLM